MKRESVTIEGRGFIINPVDMDQSLDPIDQFSEEKSLKNMNNKVVNFSKCNQCNFTSSQLHNFKTHLKTHTGERPFKCNHCDYEAARMHHLKTHLKRHTGEKSYKCNQCEYASADPGNLRTHLKTHTGEKPFKCKSATTKPQGCIV